MNVTGDSIVVTGPVPPIITRSPCLAGKPISAVEQGPVKPLPSNSTMPDRPLHRLCQVRLQEGLTRNQIARRLGIPAREVERQEQCSSDMLLSDLRRWQRALGVPIAELLDEPEGELSPPVRLRSRLLRAMKTVRTIQQRARQAPMRRLVETLVAQLVEVMPELAEAGPWPAVGHHRRKREFGQAFFRGLLLGPLDEPDDPER